MKNQTIMKREHCAMAAVTRLTANDAKDEQHKRPAANEVVDLVDEEEEQVAEEKQPRCTWICSRCTLENDSNDTICGVCNQVKGSSTNSVEHQQAEQKDDQEWYCSQCNVRNVLRGTKCTVCQAEALHPVLDKIKIVTLNVNGFGVSNAAPKGFAPMEPFSEELLKGNPDIICLQEAVNDSDVLYETMFPGYSCIGTAESHCDYVMLFLKDSLVSRATRIHVKAPAVLVRIQFAASMTVVVGSCHLPPTKAGACARLDHMKEILRHCHSGEKVLIAGDYNMRQDEDAQFEALNLVEAWKQDGSDKDKKFTWNSFANKYHANNFFGMTGRYDRIYMRGFTVSDFQLCANEPQSHKQGHFLSDHFGLRAIVKAKDEECDI